MESNCYMSTNFAFPKRTRELRKILPRSGKSPVKKNGVHKGDIFVMPVYRSQFEKIVAVKMAQDGGVFKYETIRLPYVPKVRHYTPDFYIPETDIYIEAKGRLTREDRTKMLLIKQQHPECDIRFVFANAKNKLYKNSKTTYSDWCNKHGFDWAEKTVPREWLKNE
jgi:hypothetical protein